MDETKRVNQYLTFEETLQRLPYKPSYLYKLMHLGKIPYHKPTGGRAMFLESDIEKFIARGRKAADYEIAEKADEILNCPKGKRRVLSGALTA